MAGGLAILLPLLAASLAVALLATRLRVINAFVITPVLLCLVVVAFGFHVPAVPSALLAAAQVAIGASLGLRFRLDRMRQIPRVALGGIVSGLFLFAVAFFLFALLVERVAGLDHLSSVLATAPGGLGEMIAFAGALGVLAAPVAGFQLARSVLTNLFAAPLINWIVTRNHPRHGNSLLLTIFNFSSTVSSNSPIPETVLTATGRNDAVPGA